jgi:hypothetical protein
MRDPIRLQLIEANRRFYDALEALDLDAMEEVWERSTRAACAHPGGPWLLGWAEVRRSFEAIVEATSYIEFEISGVEVRMEDPAAWVTCIERVTGEDGRAAEMAATNVFVLGQNGWRMVLHHASPVLRRGA